MKSFLVKFQHKAVLIMMHHKILLRARLDYTICKEQCFLRLSKMEIIRIPRRFQILVLSNSKLIIESIIAI